MTVSTDIQASRGELKLRLAQTPEEIEACQRLRYRVFYEELNAVANAHAAAERLDADKFDAICDHLAVVYPGASCKPQSVMLRDGELVGTYRLLRQDAASAHHGFYSQAAFDVDKAIGSHPHMSFLELGRSCVLRPYRTRPVVELLWQGIWNYVRLFKIDVMMGCASFEGVDPGAVEDGLSFLARQCAAPVEWRITAMPELYVEMRRISEDRLDIRRAWHSLPPLIKGYVRLGCYIGEGAVIDRQFNTIDVLIVLPVSAIDRRYFTHFGAPTG